MRGLIITVTGVVLLLTVCSAASSGCKDTWSASSCWQFLYDCDQPVHQQMCQKSCGICDNCKDVMGAKQCWNNVRRCNESSYQRNCRKTCGLCDVCADIHADCSSRKRQCGETWVLVGCRKTCGACHVQDTGGRESDDTMTTTTSTTAEKTSQMGNKDNQNQIGNWGEWEPWEVCSATCGKGATTRRLTCSPVGAKCQGDNTETADCHLTACCVPRNGMWGDWSTCSSSCGGGSHTRSRICTGTNSCGQPCVGKSNESTTCNVHACPRPPADLSITTDPQTSPFSAGVTVTLTCSSRDPGSPPATLTWDTVRHGMRTTPVNYRTTRLEIPNLSVEDDGLRVKCLAINTVSQNATSFLLRVDEKVSYGECRASVSSSTWEVTGYCDITKVFSSNNRYDCQWYEIKGSNPYNIPSSFNRSLITPGGKLQSGKCSFQTNISHDFPQGRESSRELKYKMYFNPGGTWSSIVNVAVVSPKAPTLICPAEVMEGSHINCTCNTSNVGEPQGRLLLLFNDQLQHTRQYGQKVIFLSRDARREDNNARISCRLHWARNMSADRDWTLRVMYPPEMPSLLIDSQTTIKYTTNISNSVYFTCRVGAGNVQSLELLKVTRNGSQILKGLSSSYPYFRMQKAGCGDSGIYYCRAGNKLGQTNSTSVHLNVLCSPKLVNGTSTKPKELKVTEGSQGQLTFEVMSNPAPTIDVFSYHQGESVSKEEPVRADLFTGKCEQNTPDLHLATCTLSTVDAMNKDNGMYNVKVRNSGGSINVPFTLIVDAQESTGNDSSLSWIGLVIALLIIIVIGVLIVFFVRRRRAAQTKTSEDKKKISSAAIARRNFEDPVYYNVTVADVTMPSSAATMTSATCTIHNGSAALTSPNDNVYTNYEKKTSLNDRGESSAGTASDDLYAVVEKTQKSSENSGKPAKPAPMPKPKRLGSASGKSGDNGGQGQSQNDSLVQESGDHSPPTTEAANATVNEEGLFYTELDFSQHRPQSQRPLPQKEETNYAAINFKLQK
ncbi:uncharacterized protein LOC112568838 isoform X2 [Pomacea canaliculata]|uniref:uncharacterized protein LOC112568838 isoform X2 n=1 Tax=Pomacea canaliculata TaxID=400727 RepID=UPI000D737048|nr:uncharacterized protein LOC112568838 isoform X2 [Pomacea canaliculata]